jgi:hypothetical protein
MQNRSVLRCLPTVSILDIGRPRWAPLGTSRIHGNRPTAPSKISLCFIPPLTFLGGTGNHGACRSSASWCGFAQRTPEKEGMREPTKRPPTAIRLCFILLADRPYLRYTGQAGMCCLSTVSILLWLRCLANRKIQCWNHGLMTGIVRSEYLFWGSTTNFYHD